MKDQELTDATMYTTIQENDSKKRNSLILPLKGTKKLNWFPDYQGSHDGPENFEESLQPMVKYDFSEPRIKISDKENETVCFFYDFSILKLFSLIKYTKKWMGI